MSKFNDWQKAKNRIKAAEAWLENRNKIDSQDHKRYELKIYISKETFKFCGQAYAGANNYHEMPCEFIDAVKFAINKHADQIFSDAMRMLEINAAHLGKSAKSEVEEMLKEIAIESDEEMRRLHPPAGEVDPH